MRHNCWRWLDCAQTSAPFSASTPNKTSKERSGCCWAGRGRIVERTLISGYLTRTKPQYILTRSWGMSWRENIPMAVRKRSFPRNARMNFVMRCFGMLATMKWPT